MLSLILFYLLYYKCHKINPNRGELYNDSPDWMKNKKSSNKSSQCLWKFFSVHCNIPTKSWRHLERKSDVKSFMNKYNWKEISYPSEKGDWERFRKIIQQLLLKFFMLKTRNYILPTFQNIIQSVKNKLFF